MLELLRMFLNNCRNEDKSNIGDFENSVRWIAQQLYRIAVLILISILEQASK